MTNFVNQMQQYAQGTVGDECQHPINRIDDDNVCHACGIDVMERKHTKNFDPKTMRLATVEDVKRIFFQLYGYELLGFSK